MAQRRLKPGDRVVVVNVCRHGAHKATIIGHEALWKGHEDEGATVATIKYRCYGERKVGTYATETMNLIEEPNPVKLSKPAIITLISLLAIFLLFGWLVGNYNSLVTANNAVRQSWSKVQTQYQRRFDTIDNLVEATKGAQGQEQKVFGAIADARKQYNANPTGAADQVDGAVTTTVANLQRLQEAYPELKSNQEVIQLMTDLKTTEGDILAARNTYNDTATNYNNNISRFPKSIFASIFGYHEKPLFESEKGSEKGAKITF